MGHFQYQTVKLPELVGDFNPSEKVLVKWSKGSIIPNIWKNKIHVPNHQPGNIGLKAEHV